MSTENINSEVNRIKQNISDSYSELSVLGATIPATKSVDNLAICVSTLQTSHIITQNGDNLVTNYGANINHDGKNTIKSLALSQRPGHLNFLVADDGNSTVKFSLDDLKIWINTPTPAATTLHQYDRVDGKATVVGFFVANDNKRYALCVLDAFYRTGSGVTWGKYNFNTLIPNYTTAEAAQAAKDTGTSNTNIIVNNYLISEYPAFLYVRQGFTVTVDGKTFLTCLPTLDELSMIYSDRVVLDTYDPTLEDYPIRSLTIFKCGGTGGLWSSNEQGPNYAWKVDANDVPHTYRKDQSSYGVVPVVEIEVDENGTVITN